MAIVKFVTAGCPLNNIFPYVMNKEKTEDKLIDGIGCLPESAMEEFLSVKRQFHKEDGRQYYHIIQSFAPEDAVSPETAHEIGMRFAEYFPGFQIVVATHINKAHTHNHITMNSVNYENGRKFHQSRDEMLAAKAYSNRLCREYGLSETEEKCTYGRLPKWKWLLRKRMEWGLAESATKEDFIEYMQNHGYGVKWTRGYKYITFTTPENQKCRDNKLFDERFLKENLEIYFALGGCSSILSEQFQSYQTPEHKPAANMTATNGLFGLMKSILEAFPPETVEDCTRADFSGHSLQELEYLEAMGIRIEPKTFRYNADAEGEQQRENGFYL